MKSIAHVTVHPSQFPESIRQDFLNCFRQRKVNHKFHYDSVKQMQQWLRLHQAYSPSRSDEECRRQYGHAMEAAIESLSATDRTVQLLGLGCGGGTKDRRMLDLLLQAGFQPRYTALDVSLPMVLNAREEALKVLEPEFIYPWIADLGATDNWEEVLADKRDADAPRLISFLGMIPNFEPDWVLPRLRRLLRPGDRLLLSANLLPGQDLQPAWSVVLPGYDNPLVRSWLLMFLQDSGIDPGKGVLRFQTSQVRENGPEFHRLKVDWICNAPLAVQVGEESFEFDCGEVMELFFSCRYRVKEMDAWLHHAGFQTRQRFVSARGDEGVWVCQPATSS